MVETVLNVQMVMRTDVLTAGSGVTTYDALRKMERKGVGSIVVVDGASPVGIFTERDLLRKVVLAGRNIRKTLLGEVMTTDIVTCSRTSSIDAAYRKMQQGNFRHLLVVSGGKLEGIVSIKDLVKFREKVLEKRVEEKTREIAVVRDRLAHSLENIQWELSVAGAFQRKLVLKKFPEAKGVRITHVYQQAESLGGDYFEVVRRSRDELGIFVADVMGHGVTSALVAIVMKMYFSEHYRRFDSPGALTTFINAELAEQIPEAYFAAGFCGYLNTKTLRMPYTQFGLPYPGVLRKKTMEYEILPPGNVPIGLQTNTTYTDGEVILQPGDRLLL
ncbi:MAG: CBS domain-containing protein, partial [bacterium]